MRNSIFRFKYKNRREYAEFYGQEISRYLGKEIKQLKPDVLVPVPLYKTKLQRRGFNQAEILANEIGKNLDIPVKKNLIIRTENTRPQKELNHIERENNLKKAFKIHQNDVKLNTVVLVDDIYTTGSTVDAIAKILKAQGIQKIYYVTLASGSGK
ncbi:MAG: ComF family protein [Lachnospiraceae bacterium]|nr:ComF family protein [Lachnospiraceae bacterium]